MESRPPPCNSSERATRPPSIARGQRLGRFSSFRNSQRDVASKRTSQRPNPDPRSQKVALSVSTIKSSYGESEVFPRRISPPRGRTALQIYDSGVDTPLRIPSGSGARSSVPEIGAAAADSVESRDPPSVGRGRKHVFDRALKENVRDLAQNVSESSGFLVNVRKSGALGNASLYLPLKR